MQTNQATAAIYSSTQREPEYVQYNDTHKNYPRTLSEAFGPQGLNPVKPATRPGRLRCAARKAADFVLMYRMYSRHHGKGASLRAAYNIAIRGVPF